MCVLMLVCVGGTNDRKGKREAMKGMEKSRRTFTANSCLSLEIKKKYPKLPTDFLRSEEALE